MNAVENRNVEVVASSKIMDKEFTVYGTVEEPLFLAKDVAEWIEHSDVTTMLKNIDEDEKLTIKIFYGGQIRRMWFLTEKGLIQLLSKSRNVSNSKRNEILMNLQKQGFLKNLYFSSPKEIEFISLLEEVLKPLGIKGKKQYKHKGKRIDFYIPSLKLAIEYDENDHKGYTYENQEGRQEMLENELDCRFIRLSDKNSNGYNIGLVINKLLEAE